MKKVMFVICSALTIFQAQAQNSILLIVNYQSGQSYNIQSYNNTVSLYNFSGNERFINSLENQGVKLPLKTTIEKSENLVLNVYKQKNDKFPFSIDLQRREIKEESEGRKLKPIIESNIKNYIKGSIRNTEVELDEVKGVNLEQMRETATKLVTNELLIDEFPSDSLKVNDVFTVSSKGKISVLSYTDITIAIDKTYTFEKIMNNKAYFKYNSIQNIEKSPNQNIELSGTGSGKLIYNISTKIIELQEGNSSMKMSFEGKDNIMTHSENIVSYKSQMNRISK